MESFLPKWKVLKNKLFIWYYTQNFGAIFGNSCYIFVEKFAFSSGCVLPFRPIRFFGTTTLYQALLKVLSVPYLSMVVKFIISMKAMPIGRFCQMFVAFLENLCCISKKAYIKVKLIYCENSTKIWRNLQSFFDTTK